MLTQDNVRIGGADGQIGSFNGHLSPEARARYVESACRYAREDLVSTYGVPPAQVDQMLEAWRSSHPDFSFAEMERGARAVESSRAGRALPRRAKEAITTSQTVAAIGLITINTVMDAGATYPAIYRDIAEVVQSNADSEVYSEEFFDDLPHIHEETEPATETRAGAAMFRIVNYVYKKALAISRRAFELDKLGTVRRQSTNFGKKWPMAQDRAFVLQVFTAFQYGNLIGQTNPVTGQPGYIPATNIAGAPGGGYGYGTGAKYAGVTGVPAAFNPAAGPVTPQNLENALIAPAVFVDPYNNEIGAGIEFDTFFGDSLDRLKAKRFAGKGANPVQIIANDPTGQTPGAFTDNVLAGEFNIATSPYVKKTRAPLSGSGYPWMMTKAKEGGLVFQTRKEWTVEQEAELAGKSFDESTYRWKGEGEFGAGVRTGRLSYAGN